MAQNGETENLCPTCGEPLVTLDRKGDAHYCRCWRDKLNNALEVAGEFPSKQSVDFELAPKMRNTGTGKLYSRQEAETVFFSSKSSVFSNWDAKGRSESEKQELKRKEPKQIHVMFKEQPEHHEESATQRSATPTARLEERLLKAGLTSDEIELVLRRYWDKATFETIRKEFEFTTTSMARRRCKKIERKIEKLGVSLLRDDEEREESGDI